VGEAGGEKEVIKDGLEWRNGGEKEKSVIKSPSARLEAWKKAPHFRGRRRRLG